MSLLSNIYKHFAKDSSLAKFSNVNLMVGTVIEFLLLEEWSKHFKSILMAPPNTFLFGECFKKKKLHNISSNLFFYLKVQSFRLIMENNFIQMTASAGHAVAYTIGPIFKHIFDCVQLYFTNGL